MQRVWGRKVGFWGEEPTLTRGAAGARLCCRGRRRHTSACRGRAAACSGCSAHPWRYPQTWSSTPRGLASKKGKFSYFLWEERKNVKNLLIFSHFRRCCCFHSFESGLIRWWLWSDLPQNAGKKRNSSLCMTQKLI